jgi:hypothetical protein
MTKKCPTCGGDGIVISEASAALDVERRLRALTAGSRSQAYRVEVAAKVAEILIGPGAARLVELEEQTRRRFYLVGKPDAHLDHFLVLAEGKREELAPQSSIQEGAKIEVKLVEVGLHDPQAGVGKVDEVSVCVADAAKLVGKKVNVQVERVLDGTAYGTVVGRAAKVEDPITAESEAEKPTRRAPAKKTDAAAGEPASAEPEAADAEVEEETVVPAVDAEIEGEAEPAAEGEGVADAGSEPRPKKKTRRGTRGGRGRKKKTATPTSSAAANGTGEPEDVPAPLARIHVPAPDLGAEEEHDSQPAEAATAEPGADGAEASKPKKKTRRGTRGGRGRKKKTTTAAAVGASDGAATAAPAPAEAKPSDWEYVPMSEWGDEVLRSE